MNLGESSARVADVILCNADMAALENVFPFARAVAVANGRFLAVGSNRDVMALKGTETTVIDAGGRTVIPGHNDSHIHSIRGGLNFNMELRRDGVPSLAPDLSMLR
jgi:predicted amidohydrolase YtcJ